MNGRLHGPALYLQAKSKRYPWLRGWAGHGASLDTVTKKESMPLPGTNPGLLLPTSLSLSLSRRPAPSLVTTGTDIPAATSKYFSKSVNYVHSLRIMDGNLIFLHIFSCEALRPMVEKKRSGRWAVFIYPCSRTTQPQNCHGYITTLW
jgi:hypothetical protein